MPTWKKIIYSGSNAELNSVTASFQGNGAGITGIISSSYALTASYASNASGLVEGQTYQITSSWAISASWAPPVPSVSASYAETSSYFRESKTFGITIDGGGSVITTGVKGDITIPFNCYIDSWYLTADQAGSIVIDVWKDVFANYPPTVADAITGTEKPTLSSQTSNSDTNLTTWSKLVTSGDVIRFNVDSVATVTRVNLIIKAFL